LKDQGLDGNNGTYVDWLRGGGFQWARRAQDRDRWRVHMNTVMDIRVLVSRSYFMSHFTTDTRKLPESLNFCFRSTSHDGIRLNTVCVQLLSSYISWKLTQIL
jgi:hypothetical protein